MKPSNNIYLKGAVRKCELIKNDDANIAYIELAMPTNEKNRDGKSIWCSYPIKVIVDDKMAQQLMQLHKICFDNQRNFNQDPENYNPIVKFIEVASGSLHVDKNNNHFVYTSQNNIKIIQDSKDNQYANRITLNGKIKAIHLVDSAAKISLDLDGKSTIDIYLLKEANELKYNNIASGKIEKGDNVNIIGSISSNFYHANNETRYICQILTSKIKVLEKKKNISKTL